LTAPKPLVFTKHAEDALREREIDLEWVADTVGDPDWVSDDPTTPGGERRFKVISAYGDRVLRVACLENATEVRIITVFFDRKARRPL
jgi:hypothetical protein